MKTKKMMLLFFSLVILLAGCGETVPPPQPSPIESAAPVMSSPTEAPPAEILPTATSTAEPPTEAATEADPTAEPAPTETAVPEATLPPSETPVPAVSTDASPQGLGFLPQEGLWGGGGTSLIITFVVGSSAGQATIRDLRLVWFGVNDCEVNHVIPDLSVVEGSAFRRFYHVGDVRYTLTGEFVSPNVVQGVFDLSYKDCGTPKISWRAVPK